MAPQRFLAAGLVALLIAGGSPALAQQANGTISGKATDEARKPYSDYSIRFRDAATAQVSGTATLQTDGKFTSDELPLGNRFLVELVKDNKVVCTEGPYPLSTGTPSKNDVNIDCGKVPAQHWLLAAAAGTAAAVALTTSSASN
jgi:hypothetical protein